MLQVTGYSIITATFQDEMLKYIGYIEICVGVGLGLGPIIAAQVLVPLGYDGTMYLFGVFNLVGCFLAICFLPGELNITLTEDEQA